MWAMIAGNVVEAQELEPPGCRGTGFTFFLVGLRVCGGVMGPGAFRVYDLPGCRVLGYSV